MNELDRIISDHELMMQDMRDGCRTAARILTRFTLAVCVVAVFMYATGLIEGMR